MGLHVFIVDDHSVAVDGICSRLTKEGLTIVGTATTGKEAVQSVPSLQVEVVLLDVRMPDMDGLATLEGIRECCPEIPAVMLSAYDNPTYVARAVALGASEYLLKSAGAKAMHEAIARAHRRESAPPESSLSRVRSVMQREIQIANLPKEMPLTSREAQVLKHVALGLSNKEIAHSLLISVEPVKEHVQNILRKVSAKDRTDAAVRAIRIGLVDL